MSITDEQKMAYAEIGYKAWPNQRDPHPYLGDPNGAETEPMDVPWSDLDECSQYQLAEQAGAIAEAARADLIDAMREKWESEYFLSGDRKGESR
jgi:hypothetical protein